MDLKHITASLNRYDYDTINQQEELSSYINPSYGWMMAGDTNFRNHMIFRLASRYDYSRYTYKPTISSWTVHMRDGDMEVKPSPSSRVVIDYSVPRLRLTQDPFDTFAAGRDPSFNKFNEGHTYPRLKILTSPLDRPITRKYEKEWLAKNRYGKTLKMPGNRRLFTNDNDFEPTHPKSTYGSRVFKYQQGFIDTFVDAFMDEVLK